MKRVKAEFVDLSGDLVGEILCRLDGETLSNCRRVCKAWYQVISDPSFAHRRRQFLVTNSKLVVVDWWRPGQTCNWRKALSFTMFMDGWMKGASKEVSLVTSRILPNDVGHFAYNPFTCDMLLYDDCQTANLLNPRTGELHTLPGYCNPTCTDLPRISYTYGYNAIKAEYVLVADDWGHQRVAKLSFTIGQTCSGWKIIWDAAFPRKAMTCGGIILNNRAYWPSIGNLPYSEGKEIVLSMDLNYNDSRDAFCIIKSPPFIPEIGLCFQDLHITLIDYKGSLGMVDTQHMANTNTLLLWLLADRCSSSWIKKFHINLGRIFSAIDPEFALSSLDSVGLKSSKQGELILHPVLCSFKRSYYILNPETETAEHLIVPRPHHPSSVAGSEPSLLWPAFLQ